MLPSCTAIAAVNAPPISSRMNDTSRSPHAAPLDLFAHGERGGAHLVRGAHVDAVHLPVRRHGQKVHDARREDDRRRGAREHAHQRAEPPDAAGLAVGGEVRQPEVVLREVARRGQRQAVSGRAGDEVERCSPLGVVE